MQASSNFGQVAELYARVRPGYLPRVFDDLIALSGVPDGGRVLEIGPGTGQATLPLVQRGYQVTGIEPDAAMAEEARRQLATYAGGAIHVSTFEDWPLPPEPFDVVLAATAFHWLDPAIRYVKSAVALKPGGALAIINTHHVAGGSDAFFVNVQACYEAHMPAASPTKRLRSVEEISPDTESLDVSGLFETPATRRYAWQQTYTTGQYTDLLSTYSDHIALTRARRQALFDCISTLIDSRFDGVLEKRYLTELTVARKHQFPT